MGCWIWDPRTHELPSLPFLFFLLFFRYLILCFYFPWQATLAFLFIPSASMASYPPLLLHVPCSRDPCLERGSPHTLEKMQWKSKYQLFPRALTTTGVYNIQYRNIYISFELNLTFNWSNWGVRFHLCSPWDAIEAFSYPVWHSCKPSILSF